MDKSKRRTYWDTFETPYQMGEQKHRVYLLDLLKEKGVKTLLDVGCGTGPIYDLIVNDPNERWLNILKYKGTDYSPAMIEIAKQQFPYGDWEVQDARNLKEENTSWDCVLLLHSLDHLDDYKAAIAEAARVSNKYVCIVLWRSFSETDNLNPKNRMGKEEGEPDWEDTYLHEYQQEDLEQAFKENGLTIEQIAEGEALNSDHSKFNFLYLLKK